MYEMLTGKVPFDADTPVSVALKQVQEEPVDPITYNPEIPVSVNRIILKAMQKDPNRRYQNATEMGKDLSLALKRPNEDFVVLALRNDDSPTQKIPTIYELEMQKNNDRNAPKIDESKTSTKKKGKFAKIAEFYSKHKFLKVITILGILGVVFIVAALLAMAGVNSSRPKQAYIPQIVFENPEEMLTEDEAKALLEEKGFSNYKIEKESSETVEAGYVISQNPNKYDFLYNLDQEIIITVSTGPEIVTLPNKIIGEKKEDILKELDTLGIKYIVDEQTSETVEAGIILSVSPEAGEEITKSTEVTLVVSSGSQFKDVDMINVIGKTEAEATAALTALNLIVDVKYDENLSKADNTVLAQTISEGKTIKEQSTVTITVNKLPVKAKVTFNVDVASFKPDTSGVTDTNTSNSTSENSTNNNTSSNTTNNNLGNVSVVFYIGGVQASTTSVPWSNSNYVWEYDRSSGTEEVRVTIGGNEVYRQSINFSVEGQVINIKK